MQSFDYVTPTRLIFGRDCISKLPEVMSALGKRVLLTYGGGSIKRHGFRSQRTILSIYLLTLCNCLCRLAYRLTVQIISITN